MFWRDNKRFMAVSLHAHHALADGVHGGKFFKLFQQYLDE
jgi:chloramphenicol O-acetyltransferase